jgi:hypothetical protein
MDISIEDQEKELQLKLRKLELKERTYQLGAGLKQKIKDEQDRIIIEKLQILQYLITASMIDESKSILGSENVYKPVFIEEEIWIFKGKIIDLVRKL